MFGFRTGASRHDPRFQGGRERDVDAHEVRVPVEGRRALGAAHDVPQPPVQVPADGHVLVVKDDPPGRVPQGEVALLFDLAVLLAVDVLAPGAVRRLRGDAGHEAPVLALGDAVASSGHPPSSSCRRGGRRPAHGKPLCYWRGRAPSPWAPSSPSWAGCGTLVSDQVAGRVTGPVPSAPLLMVVSLQVITAFAGVSS